MTPNRLAGAIDQGEGPALVFFHAFPLHERQWAAQCDAFANRYRVVAPRLSEYCDIAEPSFDGIARRLAAALAEVGIARFVQIGCSMGGYLAMAMLRHAPDAIEGTVFANTRAGADTDAVRAMRAHQINLVREGKGFAVVSDLLPKLLGAHARTALPELDETILEMSSAMDDGTYIAFLRALAARPDSASTLAASPHPACVIAGTEDVLTPAEALEDIARLLPGAEYHLLDGVGHLSNLEAPEKFTAIMQRFLENSCYGM